MSGQAYLETFSLEYPAVISSSTGRFSPWCVHLLPHSALLPLSDVLHAVLCKVDIQAVK